MQQEPIFILGSIGAHFRKLAVAKTLADNGRGIPELMRYYGMTDYIARKNLSAAAKFKSEFYRNAARLVLEADRKMKTSFDDSERILELLVLQLAQEARNG